MHVLVFLHTASVNYRGACLESEDLQNILRVETVFNSFGARFQTTKSLLLSHVAAKELNNVYRFCARFLFWAWAQHCLQDRKCAQRRLNSACASAQADQSLRCPPESALDPWLPTACPAKTMARLLRRCARSIWVFACRTCSFVGDNVSWFISDMNVSGNILKIYNVTRFAGGEYRCKVENSEGDDMCSTVLSVECKRAVL